MKFSIILTVYNVAEYLPDCLASCLEQEDMTLGKDYEIILVNDGSTDRSQEVAERIGAQLPEVSRGGYLVVNQCNSGVSIARNTGLEHSRGEYIWFVDSDDCIAPNALKLIDQFLIFSNREIVSFEKNYVPATYRYSIESALEIQKLHRPQVSAYTACNYVVHRDYLISHQINFKPGVAYGEDTLWCFWIHFHYNNPIESIGEILYLYRQRPGSAMQNRSNDKHLSSMMLMLDVYSEALIRYSDKYPDTKIKNIQARIRWTVDNILMSAVRFPRTRCLEVWDNLKDKGVLGQYITWERITLKHGLKNLINTLIGLPIKIKPYYLLLNVIMQKMQR